MIIVTHKYSYIIKKGENLPKTKKFGCGGRGDLTVTLLFKNCEIDKIHGRLVY